MRPISREKPVRFVEKRTLRILVVRHANSMLNHQCQTNWIPFLYWRKQTFIINSMHAFFYCKDLKKMPFLGAFSVYVAQTYCDIKILLIVCDGDLKYENIKSSHFLQEISFELKLFEKSLYLVLEIFCWSTWTHFLQSHCQFSWNL